MFTSIGDMPDYQNPQVLHKNCLPARSYFIPFPSLGAAQTLCRGSLSPNYTLLSGKWDFKYFKSPMYIEEDDISGRSAEGYESVPVPSCWQFTGHEIPFYVNNDFTCPAVPPLVPAFNCCAVYRREVVLDKEQAKKRKVLTFLGVASGFTLFINGREFGYSQGSHNMSEFDVSAALTEGKNLICALVYKWTDGSYLESQDMFRSNGIFRDVYLVCTENDYIEDFKFTYKKTEGGFDCSLLVTARAIGDCVVEARLLDRAGNECARARGGEELNFFVNNPLLWTAETPHCYYLYICLYVGGREVECVRQVTGFKVVDYGGRDLRINGVPVKLKGVNRHESVPDAGYAVSCERNRLDLELIKKFNFNTVRFSHYPPHPEMLEMCDELGLYVIDEADLECYGSMNFDLNYFGNSPEFEQPFLDRVERMYQRDKNHPCVVMWSLGNEAGTGVNFDRCRDYIKRHDQSLPVQYETCFREYKEGEKCGYDVVSMMYSDLDCIKSWIEKGDRRPFYLCEFAHGMGLSPGGLKNYMQLMYECENFVGACVWEFADHAVLHEKGPVKYTYGGEHGEYIHDANFCCDGLFLPDRTPSSGAYEVRCAFRPLIAQNCQYKDGQLRFEVYNTYSFLNAEVCELRYAVVSEGKTVEEGSLNSHIPPLTARAYTLAVDEKLADCLVQLRTFSGGELIGSEELEVTPYRSKEQTDEKKSEQINDCTADFTVREDKEGWTFKVGDKSLAFDRRTCTIGSMKIGDTELLSRAPKNTGYTFYSGPLTGFLPGIWHAPTDNELYIQKEWRKNGYDMMWVSFYSLVSEFTKEGAAFTAEGLLSPPKYGKEFKLRMRYEIGGDLSVRVECAVTPCRGELPMLPRLGVSAELDETLCNIRYYGLGGGENYPDYRMAALSGIYETTAEGMHCYYVRPQENGSRGGVRWFEATDKQGRGLRVSACDTLLSFSVKPYTARALEKAAHEEQIVRDTLVMTVDGFVGGVGSNSCGPLPFAQYRILPKKDEPLCFSFKTQFIG